MTAPGARAPLLRFALEGERVRKAVGVIERETPRLAAGLRRAVPFLARRGVPITLSHARATPVAELLEGFARPFHAAHFVTKPGRAAGALLVDAGAVALFLDGVLGGNGTMLPELNPAGLTAPQNALMGGLANNIVNAFSNTLRDAIGLELELCEAAIEPSNVESAPIACMIELGENEHVGRIALLLAKEPLLSSATGDDPEPPKVRDARIESVLEDVELVVIAELARLRLRLAAIAALRVGDTLRLDVPVSGLVSVRANGQPLFQGRPVTSGGRIAIRIAGGHEP